MSSTRTKFNHKRRFVSNLPASGELARLAAELRYGGNPLEVNDDFRARVIAQWNQAHE